MLCCENCDFQCAIKSINHTGMSANSGAVKNQLNRVLINYSSHKQKESKSAGGTKKNQGSLSRDECRDEEGKRNVSAYEEYRRSMGLPCNIISKK